MFFAVWLLRTLFKMAWTIAPTSFLGSTCVTNNDDTKRREQEGGGGGYWAQHMTIRKTLWYLGAQSFLPHFCMTGKRPGWQMRWPSGPDVRWTKRYKINSSPETVVQVVSTLRRNVPYFYNTFWVIKFTLVSALILGLKQPWWSAALDLHLVWAQSIWGATGTWSHHHHVFVRFHGEPAIARFTMNMYLYACAYHPPIG